MIPVEYYNNAYFASLTVLVLFMVFPLIKPNPLTVRTSYRLSWFSVIIILFTVLFIGLRDPWGAFKYLGDTQAYTRMFSNAEMPKFLASRDFGFDLFMYICFKVMSVQVFYLLCALLYVILPYLSFKKWFDRRAWLALLVYITAMSFWAFGINGLRNGLSAAFFIYALSFIKQPVKMAFWFILAVSFHKSMLLPVFSFLATYYLNNTKVLIYIWLCSIPISYFFGNSLEMYISGLFNSIGFVDKRIDSLFANEIEGISINRSFRLDFILYSSIAVLLGYYYVVKRKFWDVLYTRMLNTYLLSNTVWIFMIYGTYTNRTAYLSWFLMPVVLVYPLLKKIMLKRQTNFIFLIIIGSLMFTLLLYIL